MSELLEFYRCDICGHIIQIMHEGDGELVCCGKPMRKLIPSGLSNEKEEKHVPVFRENKIFVGSEPHPMSAEHHIEFIEAVSMDKKQVKIQFLTPEKDNPEMELKDPSSCHSAYEYCNLHGLWQGEKE